MYGWILELKSGTNTIQFFMTIKRVKCKSSQETEALKFVRQLQTN